MQELSLNILDIAMNSVKAGATLISITIEETAEQLILTIKDNGCGMSGEMILRVSDPFCTTRTTRKVGLGIPFLKLAAEQTEGYISIESVEKSVSVENCGTVISAVFFKNHIDFTPLGDINSTILTLIQGSPDIDFSFCHTNAGTGKEISLETAQIKEVLDGLPINSPEILVWIGENLAEQYGV